MPDPFHLLNLNIVFMPAEISHNPMFLENVPEPISFFSAIDAEAAVVIVAIISGIKEWKRVPRVAPTRKSRRVRNHKGLESGLSCFAQVSVEPVNGLIGKGAVVKHRISSENREVATAHVKGIGQAEIRLGTRRSVNHVPQHFLENLEVFHLREIRR